MAKTKGGKGEPSPSETFPPFARSSLSGKHQDMLDAVFQKPNRPDIPWRQIEALFEALGGSVENGKGSRRRVFLRGRRAVFHEPHPERVTDKGAVTSVRDFLVSAGVNP